MSSENITAGISNITVRITMVVVMLMLLMMVTIMVLLSINITDMIFERVMIFMVFCLPCTSLRNRRGNLGFPSP